MTHTIGWRERAASRTRSDSGDDLDPSLVHRLEPLSLLLGILVWDGADGVAALALAVGGLHYHVRVLMTILSTSISVSARLSSDDRSRRAHVDAQTVACPLSVASKAATCRVR